MLLFTNGVHVVIKMKNSKEKKIKQNGKKEKTRTRNEALLSLFVTTVAFFLLRIFSGLEISNGTSYVFYQKSYPYIFFAMFLITALMFLPFIIKSNELSVYLVPPTLISCFGMIKIDSDTGILSTYSDFLPATAFLCFLLISVLWAYSGQSVLGILGNVLLCIIFPWFSLTFSPFLTAAAILFEEKNEILKKISPIINALITLGFSVYFIIKNDTGEFYFNKYFVPVLLLFVFTAVFFAIQKKPLYSLLAVLPLLPLLSGIFYGIFPTSRFILSASVAPFVALISISAMSDKNGTIKECAEKIVHTPYLYIILTAFCLTTACCYFSIPGLFRDTYT